MAKEAIELNNSAFLSNTVVSGAVGGVGGGAHVDFVANANTVATVHVPLERAMTSALMNTSISLHEFTYPSCANNKFEVLHILKLSQGLKAALNQCALSGSKS